MLKVKAFRALRPSEDMAALVPSRPYDTVTREEAVELACGNPWSFLRVVRPDLALPPEISPHDDRAYTLARETFERFVSAGALERDEAPCVYIYRQRMGSHAQTGIVACCHADDYRNSVIRRHERTRTDKEEDRTRHILAVRAHTGLVFLAYRDRASLDELVAKTQTEPPLYDVAMPDGVVHTIWRAPRPEALLEALSAVSTAYIADGHHRAAASVRAAAREEGRGTGGPDAEHNWFPAVFFPAGQLRILPYNRVVKDLNGLSVPAFLAEIERRFDVRVDADPVPAGPGRVAMYLAGRWYGLSWRTAGEVGAAEALDVARLQSELLEPALGICDPRTDPRIAFVGGVAGAEALSDMVDDGRAAAAFSMYPVTVDAMMAIADTGGMMPPKSTWFEPKLRSGFLVHTF